MRVQNPAHVLRLETVLRELCLEHLLLADPALHPEAVHDLRVGGARVDENRGVAAEDQVAEGRHPKANAHVLAEDEEARVELDVDQRQDLDLKTHGFSLLRSAVGRPCDSNHGTLQGEDGVVSTSSAPRSRARPTLHPRVVEWSATPP